MCGRRAHMWVKSANYPFYPLHEQKRGDDLFCSA
nr:MAG TPA: hypothetical protein [Caudoviricetes sp.]DAK69351.1 MAG TPA: hypothetical protein [Caudoviricetes sp.]